MTDFAFVSQFVASLMRMSRQAESTNKRTIGLHQNRFLMPTSEGQNPSPTLLIKSRSAKLQSLCQS